MFEIASAVQRRQTTTKCFLALNFFHIAFILLFFRLHLYINISFFCVVLGLEQSMQIPQVRFYAVMRLCDLDIHYALLLSESA